MPRCGTRLSASRVRLDSASVTPSSLWVHPRVAAILRTAGLAFDQRSEHWQGRRSSVVGLPGPARAPEHDREAWWLRATEPAEFGDGRVVVGQLAGSSVPCGTRPPPPTIARHRQHDAEVVVIIAVAVAEVGDGGDVVGQLLEDGQCPAVLGFRFPACPRHTA